jgi:hypothetical protein
MNIYNENVGWSFLNHRLSLSASNKREPNDCLNGKRFFQVSKWIAVTEHNIDNSSGSVE